jgi:hypothetical protein
MHAKRFGMPLQDAETIALQALAFFASDEARLSRFIRETGISLDELHVSAGEHHVMTAVLDMLLRDEPNLLMFTANSGLEPDAVTRAHDAISPAGFNE